MKKWVIVGISLLVIIFLYLAYYEIFIDKPEYWVIEVPRIEKSNIYESPYANNEEFSINTDHETGYDYYIWRLYVYADLDNEKGLDTLEKVVDYYDQSILELGWEEASLDFCSTYQEWRPNGVYKAYTHENRNIKPRACMVVWPNIGLSNYVDILIKTINPSLDVSANWDRVF